MSCAHPGCWESNKLTATLAGTTISHLGEFTYMKRNVSSGKKSPKCVQNNWRPKIGLIFSSNIEKPPTLNKTYCNFTVKLSSPIFYHQSRKIVKSIIELLFLCPFRMYIFNLFQQEKNKPLRLHRGVTWGCVNRYNGWPGPTPRIKTFRNHWSMERPRRCHQRVTDLERCGTNCWREKSTPWVSNLEYMYCLLLLILYIIVGFSVHNKVLNKTPFR